MAEDKKFIFYQKVEEVKGQRLHSQGGKNVKALRTCTVQTLQTRV